MRVARSISDVPEGLPYPVVTLGNFDGVHRGHEHLLARVQAVAAANAGTSVVVTFRPHPVVVLRPDRSFRLICSYDRKLELLEAVGIDLVLEVPFDRSIAQWPAERFVDELLVGGLGLRWFVAGPDSRFGKGRAGDAELLQAVGPGLGFGVESIAPLQLDGHPASSSRIRQLAAAGDVAAAAVVLGRPLSLSGQVVEGDRRGRTIGFPTANLAPSSGLVPRHGVYAAWAVLQGETQRRPAVINVGTRPTFDGKALSVEAHLLDFEGDLYGKRLTLKLVDRIRDELRFDGVDALVAQIHADVESARRQLG